MIMTFFGGIAEFETSLFLTQTQEGREAAKARGVAFGRPPKLQDDQKKLVLELISVGKSISTIAGTFNVHLARIYRCINERRSLWRSAVPLSTTSQQHLAHEALPWKATKAEVTVRMSAASQWMPSSRIIWHESGAARIKVGKTAHYEAIKSDNSEGSQG